VFIDDKLVAIVAVEPILGAEPHESPVVLEDAGHRALGETLFDGEAIETNDAVLDFLQA
jgi:hypothetical protein